MSKKVSINSKIRKVTGISGTVSHKGITYKEVKSSNLKGYYYNSKKKELYVLFNTMIAYKYTGISRYIFTRFKSATSMGKYFHQSIRLKYKYTVL